MKATIRVPMRESFAYVELELEVEQKMEGLKKVMELYKDTLGLSKEGQSDNKDNW